MTSAGSPRCHLSHAASTTKDLQRRSFPQRSLFKQERHSVLGAALRSRNTEVSLRPVHVDFTMSAKAGVAQSLGTALPPGTRTVEPFVGCLTSHRRQPAVIVRIRMRNMQKSEKDGVRRENFPMVVDRAEPPRPASDAYRALSVVSIARQNVHAQQNAE